MSEKGWSKGAEDLLLRADKRLSRNLFPENTGKDPYGSRARISRNVNARRAGIDTDTQNYETKGYMGNRRRQTELSALDEQIQMVKAKRLREGRK